MTETQRHSRRHSRSCCRFVLQSLHGLFLFPQVDSETESDCDTNRLRRGLEAKNAGVKLEVKNAGVQRVGAVSREKAERELREGAREALSPSFDRRRRRRRRRDIDDS